MNPKRRTEQCTGVPAASAEKEDDLFKDPGWQDPVLASFAAGPSMPGHHTNAQQSSGGALSASPAHSGPGLDDIFGGAPSRPAGSMGGVPLPPRLAPPPPGSQAVQFAPKKSPTVAPLGRQTSQPDSLI